MMKQIKKTWLLLLTLTLFAMPVHANSTNEISTIITFNVAARFLENGDIEITWIPYETEVMVIAADPETGLPALAAGDTGTLLINKDYYANTSLLVYAATSVKSERLTLEVQPYQSPFQSSLPEVETNPAAEPEKSMLNESDPWGGYRQPPEAAITDNEPEENPASPTITVAAAARTASPDQENPPAVAGETTDTEVTSQNIPGVSEEEQAALNQQKEELNFLIPIFVAIAGLTIGVFAVLNLRKLGKG